MARSNALALAHITLFGLIFGSAFVLIPINANLIATATLVVYVGTHRSLTGAGNDGEQKQFETMKRNDAYKFPIFAGITLTSLFMLFKFFDKEWVNFFIGVYVTFISIAIVAGNIMPILAMLGLKPKSEVFGLSVWIPFSFYLLGDGSAPSESSSTEDKSKSSEPPAAAVVPLDTVDVAPDNVLRVRVSSNGAVSLFIGLLVTLVYNKTKHFVANNLIGVAFSFQALESMSLGTYKTGCILLILLFFYDIFFVFGTDIMVGVATSVDAPIAVRFPKAFATKDADAQFSILGLGDIVLPGVFVALLLRFDAIRAGLELGKVDHTNTTFSKPIYNLTILFYALGLCATVFVMYFFKHAQPALLYLVPACLLASLLGGLATGSMKELWNYDEEQKAIEPTAGADGEKVKAS